MQSEYMKIPKERLAVLIGKNGETKKEIEQRTGVKIEVDSKSGEVEISSKPNNALNYYIAINIVKAIARGFSPEHALLLLGEDYYLDVIDLTDYVGKKEKEIANKKGRVIGRRGKMRSTIEEQTNTLISVYGKTIALIGRAEEMGTARRAVEMLLEGAQHTSVCDFLRKKRFLAEKEFEI